MIGALWTGISGLRTARTAIDNESNNIANVNTIGYKASRVSFADMMYQDGIGKGSTVESAEKQYIQGNLSTTGSEYDVGLDGDGFIPVSKENSNGTSETYYTRAGNLRMGEKGTLQDSNGYEVQGWAMSKLSTSDIVSTNPNWSHFNDKFTKIAGNQIIKFSKKIQTYAAKITDYISSARSDSHKLTGSNLNKSASDKISDIEQLTRRYQKALSSYSKDPNALSSPSIAQLSQITFPTGVLKQKGDTLNVYINGNLYSVEYQSKRNRNESIAATYKALADKISSITGLRAYTVDNNGNQSTKLSDVLNGSIKIESIDPGKDFVIGDVYETNNTIKTDGTKKTITLAVQGTGSGAVESARKALSNTVSGKQYDVYPNTGVNNQQRTWKAGDEVDFQITINGVAYQYPTITVSGTPSNLKPASYEDALNQIIGNINRDTRFNSTIEAKNINGNLVLEAKAYAKEFTSGGLTLRYTSIGGGRAVTYSDNEDRDSNLSGNNGVNGEFMQLISTVDQETSKTSLQLQLDALDLTSTPLARFSVDEQGLITMTQDGVDYIVGQIAVAQFSDNIGLESIGNNLLAQTVKSGNPRYTTNNDNGTTIRDRTLELSTADLSQSLVNLMVYQRAFEANSKSITTADQILSTLIDLKR